MSIKVDYAIIHKIEKEGPPVGHLDLSHTDLIVTDEKVKSFIEQLDSRLKSNYHFATFSKAKRKHIGSFEDELNEMITKGFPKKEYIDFTHMQSDILLRLLNEKPTSRGGYLIYSLYTILGSLKRDLFGVFLVRDKQDLTIQKNPHINSYELTDLVHVDLDALAMACRIDLSAKKKNSDRFIRFFRYRRQDVSEYFMKWIAADPLETSKEDTERLIEILYKLEPLNRDGQEIERDVFLKNAYSYIEASERNVNLTKLSEHLFGEGKESTIRDFAEEQSLELATEFTANPRQLKRLKIISITAKNITLKFPPGMLKDEISTDVSEPDRVIIKSKELADKIRQEKTDYAD
jgi:nucleoid-associated protein YejK